MAFLNLQTILPPEQHTLKVAQHTLIFLISNRKISQSKIIARENNMRIKLRQATGEKVST